MSYDHKIIDQKYHLKGLISPAVCNQLIKFYEDNKNLSLPEDSYKFGEDKTKNKQEIDNFNCLNLSKNMDKEGFKDTSNLILKYLKIVLVNHAMYVRNNLCPTFENTFMPHTANIRIIKYDVGQLIKDHSDVTQNIRCSLTINLNDYYEGGEFRFFGGQVKVSLSAGEAMLFPGEPLWIHGTEPITKGSRYTINCFLRQ